MDKVRGRPVRPLRLLGAGVWGDKQFDGKRDDMHTEFCRALASIHTKYRGSSDSFIQHPQGSGRHRGVGIPAIQS